MPRPGPGAHVLQRADQLPDDFFVVIIKEQAHRLAEPNHHVRRQQPLTLLAFPGLSEDVLDQIPRDHISEHAKRYRVNQSTVFHRLLPRPLRHVQILFSTGALS